MKLFEILDRKELINMPFSSTHVRISSSFKMNFYYIFTYDMFPFYLPAHHLKWSLCNSNFGSFWYHWEFIHSLSHQHEIVIRIFTYWNYNTFIINHFQRMPHDSFHCLTKKMFKGWNYSMYQLSFVMIFLLWSWHTKGSI